MINHSIVSNYTIIHIEPVYMFNNKYEIILSRNDITGDYITDFYKVRY